MDLTGDVLISPDTRVIRVVFQVSECRAWDGAEVSSFPGRRP
jgi:hypothetical protein